MEYADSYEYEETPRSRVVILSGFRSKPTYAAFKIIFKDHQAAETLVDSGPIEVEIDDRLLDYVEAWLAPDESIEDLDQNATRIIALTIPGRSKGASTSQNSLRIMDLDGTLFTPSMLIAAKIVTNDEAQHLAYLGLSTLCGCAVSVIRCMTKTENFWLQLEFLSIPDAVQFWTRIEYERKRSWIDTDMAFLKIEGQPYHETNDGQLKIRYSTEEMQELMSFDDSETGSQLIVVDREGRSTNAIAVPHFRWDNSRSESRGA
ncbi:hypothetical protein BDV96DRAFT_649095 [Lophiotrema nucula]|uniref:Uncharacterized protein n=1 Tax=Lophiotrema nucula TaxID=690887 RepID=A0A6A5YZR2_9PLEO|nr:hypothetical protein BDV96DRAFT_649095 [Lophiotrema nucula]